MPANQANNNAQNQANNANTNTNANANNGVNNANNQNNIKRPWGSHNGPRQDLPPWHVLNLDPNPSTSIEEQMHLARARAELDIDKISK